MGTATPEDLIAARGVALLRLTPVAFPKDNAHSKTARDVGQPPWDLPFLRVLPLNQVHVCNYDKCFGTNQLSGVEVMSSAGLPAECKVPEEADLTQKVNSLESAPSCQLEGCFEFRAELWVRGQQRPEPFLERLVAGVFCCFETLLH